MPQEFQAVVVHGRETPQRFDDAEDAHSPIESDRTLKSAEFLLWSKGPCPWPPSTLFKESVVVFGRSEILGFLERITNALYDHEDDHNFCESNEKALVEGRELLARLTK